MSGESSNPVDGVAHAYSHGRSFEVDGPRMPQSFTRKGKTADRPYGSPAVYYSVGNTTHFAPA